MSEQLQPTQADADQHRKDNGKQSQTHIQKNLKSINDDLHRIIVRYLTVIALSEEHNRTECCKLLLHFLQQLYPTKNNKQDRKTDSVGQLFAEAEAIEELTRLYEENRVEFQSRTLNFCLNELKKYLENHPDLKTILSESTILSEDAKTKLLSTNEMDLDQLYGNVDHLKHSIKTIRYLETRTTIPDIKTTLHDTKIQPTFIKLLENNVIFQRFLEQFITKFSVVNEPTLPDLNTPLHYAVKNRNESFIQWILNQPEVDINSRNKQRKTALFILCEQFDDAMKQIKNDQSIPTEVGTIQKNILLLLDHGADFNICGDQLRLSFDLLMRHQSKVQPFLELCQRSFKSTIVKVTKQRRLEFNPVDKVNITVTLLEILLKFKQEQEFKTMFQSLKVDEQNVKSVIKNLLHVAVDLGSDEIVKLIVSKAGSKIFAESHIITGAEQKRFTKLTHRVELKGLLKKICEHGMVTSLKLLLEKINDRVLVNDDPILVVALTKANSLAKDSDAQLKVLECAKLLAVNPKIYLSRADNFGNTALHAALKFGFTDIALDLAKQSFAFLGVRNSKHLTPLDYASYDFCKQYFDECIETDKNRRYREEVRLNLNGLNPYYVKKGKTKDNKQWHDHEKFPPLCRSNKPRFDTEMDVVKKMAESKELKPLLLHPVIYTFILIKWLRLSLWCYSNLIVTLLTTIIFGSYSILSITFGKECTCLRILSGIGFTYIIIREIFRVLMLRRQCSFKIENLFDICIIITGMISIFVEPQPVYCSLTVILFAVQLIRLIGLLPFNSISIYMHMFQTVAANFFKSLLLFCPLLLAFIFSFFLSYNDFSDPISVNATQEERFNSFGSVVNAAIKTLVMTTGEFDASESDIIGGRTIIFVLFIFFAPIVILNLINGLAVSDITAIRDESELISISKKVFILARYEFSLRNIPRLVHRMFPTPFFKHYSFMIKIRPEEHRKIFVQPRVNRQFLKNESETISENTKQVKHSTKKLKNPEEIPLTSVSSNQETSIPIESDVIQEKEKTNPRPEKSKYKESLKEECWQSVPKLKLDCLVFSGETPEKCLKSLKSSFLSRWKRWLMASLDAHFMEETLRVADQNIKNEKSKK